MQKAREYGCVVFNPRFTFPTGLQEAPNHPSWDETQATKRPCSKMSQDCVNTAKYRIINIIIIICIFM